MASCSIGSRSGPCPRVATAVSGRHGRGATALAAARLASPAPAPTFPAPALTLAPRRPRLGLGGRPSALPSPCRAPRAPRAAAGDVPPPPAPPAEEEQATATPRKTLPVKDEDVRALTAVQAVGDVELKVGIRGRGMFATRDFKADEVVYSVPLESCICVQETGENVGPNMMKHMELWQKQHAEVPDLLLRFSRAPDIPAEERLAVLLLWAVQKGGPRWMGPLAALLPQAGQDGLTVPMLWDEHQLKDLQDPGIEMSVKTKTSLARESYERTFKDEQGQELAALVGVTDFEAYHWALSIVRTRGICDTFGPNETAAMIIPGVDMANHEFECNSEGTINPNGTFDIVALKDIPEGEEVCLAYQEKMGSMPLMERYGFVVPSNPTDRVPIPGSISPDELRAMALNPQLFMAAVGGMVGAGLPRGRAEVFLKSLPLLDQDENSVEGQQARAIKLLAACDAAMKSYPTTIEEDIAALQQPGMTSQLGTSICYRLEQKFILRDAMAACKGYARILPGLVQGIAEEQEKAAAAAAGGGAGAPGGAGGAGFPTMPGGGGAPDPPPAAAAAEAAGEFPSMMGGAAPAAEAAGEFPSMMGGGEAAAPAPPAPPPAAAAPPPTPPPTPPPAPATNLPPPAAAPAAAEEEAASGGSFFADVDADEKLF